MHRRVRRDETGTTGGFTPVAVLWGLATHLDSAIVLGSEKVGDPLTLGGIKAAQLKLTVLQQERGAYRIKALIFTRLT